MNCREIIKELHKLAEGKRTDNSDEAVAEAVEIIEDWADKYSFHREDEAKREKMAQATLRFIPMLLKKNPKRWAIWDRKKNSWAESKTGHLFVYVNEEAANRKAEKLEEADK